LGRAVFRDTFELMKTKMNSTKLISATILLVLLSLATLAQDKNTGAVKGKVRVEKGSPAGVAVILSQGEREVARGTSDKHGDFMIARIAPGVYSVTLRKPGLTVGSIPNIEVKADKTRSLGDHLYLSIDEGSIAFIRGSVFTEAGRSVPYVRVELARILSGDSIEKIDTRVTSDTGEFVFRLPPDVAKYRVTVKADGAQPVSKDVDVDSAAVFRVALTLKPIPQ